MGVLTFSDEITSAKPALDMERILDAFKATERSAPDAVSPAGARSSYQIIQPTFHGIRRLRPDLPEIQFSDLSKPENEETARQYAQAIVEDIASRTPDPKDIAAVYNSGKTAKNAPASTKTNYVPRFLAALRGAVSPSEVQAAETSDGRLVAARDVSPGASGGLTFGQEIQAARPLTFGDEIKGAPEPVSEKDIADYFTGGTPSFGKAAVGVIGESPLGVAEQFLFKHAEIPLLETLAGKDSPAATNARRRFAEQGAFLDEAEQEAAQIRERGGLPSLGLGAIGIGATIAPALLAPETLLSVPGFAATGAVTGSLRPFTGPGEGTAEEAIKGAATEGGQNALMALLFGGAGRVGSAVAPGSRLAQLGAQAGAGAIAGGVTGGPQGAFESALLSVPFGAISPTRPGLAGAPFKERLGAAVNPLEDLLPFGTRLQGRQLRAGTSALMTERGLRGELGIEEPPTPGDLAAAKVSNEGILAAIGIGRQARSTGEQFEAASGIERFLKTFGRPPTADEFKAMAVSNQDFLSFNVPLGDLRIGGRPPGFTTLPEGQPTTGLHLLETGQGPEAIASKPPEVILRRSIGPLESALVNISGADGQVLRDTLARLAADANRKGPGTPGETILGNLIRKKGAGLSREEAAVTRASLAAAENIGAAPEGLTETVEAVDDARHRVAEAVAARGGTMITSEAVPEALLPPAGMANLNLARMSEADLLIALDQFPALARLRDPRIVLGSNPLLARVYENVNLSDHQKRILLFGGPDGPGWTDTFLELLTHKRALGVGHKLLAAQDRELIGRGLDGQADALKALAARPDLEPRFQGLRGLLNEIARTAGLPPDRVISEYFPHMIKLMTDFHADLPEAVSRGLGPRADSLNQRLNEALRRRTADEVRLIRNALMGRLTVEDALASTPYLIEPAREVKSALREAIDATGQHGKAGAEFVRGYMNSLLKQDAIGRRLANAPLDVLVQLPLKKLFFGSLDRDRIDLSPKFLDYDAYNVLKVYIYSAARKITYDSNAPTINALLEQVRGKAGAGSRAYQFALEYIDNYAGRKTAAQNEWLAQRLGRSKVLTRLSKSNVKVLRDIATAVRTPFPTTRTANFIKTVEFSSKIGLNAISPIVNSFQPLVNVAPILSTNAKGQHIPGLGELWLGRAFLQWTNWGGYRQIRQFAMQDGVLDFVGKFDFDPEVLGRTSRKVIQALTFAFRYSESHNRAWTYAAGYMKRYADLKAQVTSGEITALDAQNAARLYARNLVDRTQFSGGRVGTPLGLQGPITSVLSQFKTFSIKEADLFKSMTFAEKVHFAALLYMLAGTSAVPFIDSLDPNEKTFRGVLRVAGIDLSDQFDLMSIIGLPRSTQELGNLAGPFVNDLYRFGENPTAENALRFAPGGVQARRVLKGNTTMQRLFGPRAVQAGGAL